MGVALCQGVWGSVPCTCARTHMHVHVGVSNDVIRDSPGFPYGGSHLHENIMFIHVCTCAHVRACAHMHGASPQTS